MLYGHRLHASNMGRSILLLICYLLFETTVAGEFDVTTILRYDTRWLGVLPGNDLFSPSLDLAPALITVHARNDAYGLPFLLPDGTVHDANVGIDMQPCNMHTSVCRWIPSNFTKTSAIGKTPLIARDNPTVWSLNGTKGSLLGQYFYPTNEKLCVSVTYKGNNNTIITVAEVSSQDIKQDFVHMQTTDMLGGWETAIYRAELPRERIGEIAVVELTAQSPAGSELLVQRIAGCNGKGDEDILVLKGNVNHLSVGCDAAISGYSSNEDLSLEVITTESQSAVKIKNGDRNLQPWFWFGLGGDEISDEDRSSETHSAERRKNDNNNVWDVFGLGDAEIPEEDENLEYVTMPHPEEMNTDDWTSETVNTESYYEVKPRIDDKCLNDGIYNEKKGECLCPEGFIGLNCQIGCGVNKYGSKCEGRCSKTAGGCKGMKLCPPKRACRCAPGLRGRYCDSECEVGTYGADCNQQCGSCSHSDCDPYTGQCLDGCLDGFYPPYCKQNYAYVSQPPTILRRGFQYLIIGANFQPETILGKGTPRFYQLQYKATEEFVWMKQEPKFMFYGNIQDNITDLKCATSYQVRIVLLDVDGGSYQGEKVPVLTDETECAVPDTVQYDLHTVNSTHNGFQVVWNYMNEDPLSCPLLNFELELYEDWGWTQKFKDSTTSTTLTGLLPGYQYELRVRVITSGGEAPFSNVIKASTMGKDPEKVFDFRLVSARFNELEVKWTPPLETAGKIETYRLSYMCRKLLACEMQDCSHSEGYVDVSGTSAVLRNLLPHAQYVLYVAAKAASWGPMSQLLVVTNMSAPAVSPDPSSKAVSRRTNTSFTIQWQPPHNCSALNGYLQGYRYVLLGHNLEATTTSTSATFTDLTPHTQYTVWVSVVTSGGWSPNSHLLISADTTATVPGPVQNLTVYETARRRLGVRWKAPKYTFGALKSFTVSYSSDPNNTISSMIDPSPCVIWPHLYCHTITRLQPDKEYRILVQARNDEIEEDGEAAVVTAVTKETAPEAPSYIRVARQTQTSLAVEWGLPDLLNGRLKSFVVNMQETDSLNSSECCQYFPIQEVLVGNDQTNYSYEVSDLHPASTYMISVTAKTVSLGPAVSITAHTRPPVPSMDGMIEISSPVTSSPTVKILPATNNKDLISGYLVLVLPLSSGAITFDTVIWKDWLSDELKRLVNGNFYIAADFNQVDLEEKDDFVLGLGSPVTAGKWSEIRDPSLEPGETYLLGLVLISEYCGVHSVGYTETPAFVVQSET